ncbi:MAG: eukaryotic-like serine/threonine-protein kinase, partial [Blastocatellia bacterium]|nr:eukaryotic-like serine/threonine-protein kinase [Blastocatellia bacterium]
MKSKDWQQIETLFLRALECEPGERAALLDQSCSGNEPLRHRIEALIVAHEHAGSVMKSLTSEVTAKLITVDQGGPLTPQRFEHYEVIAPLGSGGMGDVYLAHDTRLGRKVALKLLPDSFTKDADRLRRFQQEARATSALNHPNILTIYEIGQVQGRPFIAMEFIDGVTLRQYMTTTPMKVGEALDTALQVAGALTEAHAVGIVHRDVKPENIMVRRDGIVKVVDFGLAKLAGRAMPHDTEVPTRGIVNTEPGMVMGTVQYMSPEQVRGLETDARTDIWSLGIVLYEMLAGLTPFAEATMGDCIVSILDRDPLPLAHYFADMPEAAQVIVTKALTKKKENRYQTIGEMLRELRRLKQRLEVTTELDRSTPETADEGALKAGEGRASFAETKTPGTRTDETQARRTAEGGESWIGGVRQSRKGLLIALTALALILTGVSFGLYKVLIQRPPSLPSPPFQRMKISKLTSTSKADEAAISPDGKYVVYSTEDAGRQSLWLRHVATNTDKEIIAAAPMVYRGLIFSHDGNYIYFIGSEEGKAQDSLYQVTVLGSDMRKLSGNVGSSASNITKVASITLSPDDRRVAFARHGEGNGERALIMMKTDGTEERKLLTRGMTDRIGEPSWSPDGKTIACPVLNIPTGFASTLIEVNVEDGKERQISSQKWWSVGRLAWVREGNGFVMTASDQPFGVTQVWHVSYPDGKGRRVTNDLNEYYDVSLTADSSTLVVMQNSRQPTLLIAPNGDANRARPITFGDGSASDFSWTPDNRIIYDSMASGKRGVWIMEADGKNRKQLAAVADVSIDASMTRDLRYIVFAAYSGGSFNLWRMNVDGGNLKQLTDDGGVIPSLTADSKWVVYFKLTATGGQIRRVPIEGGAPVAVTGEDVNAIAPIVSPDGKWIACSYSSA